ncbi:TetR/AcrR family transcriptional regulator [Actinomadura spongiicola]|uniref:TetR/AcrR family transcriptional regulator n=2 Tax=Actinomadura spongiicola TaxID=2303421 RepID=A0A372G797_9ACTN|nr:TetR/AcrR family transcriptional regulator [Actinomadura spongiicola]
MSPERRREMIVRTALPLVAEHGTAVTTGQIARAAGIGEATIFRVFADKNELLDACVAEALRPDHVLAEIAGIPLDGPLRDRLAEVGAAVEAYLDRMGMILGALRATGRREPPTPPTPGEDDAPPDGEGRPSLPDRDTAMNRTRDAIAELFEPDRDRLRLPPAQLASLFMGLLFARSRPHTGPDAPSIEEYLDVFLHGALKERSTE